MTNRLSISGFSALSHPVRLALFQTLCQRAPDTVSAGELASGFDIPPSTMTGHLQALERAGLIRAQRRSRFMLYSLDHEGTRQFLKFLIQDCCGDQPQLVQGIVGAAESALQEAS